MKAVVQRVKNCHVTVADKIVSRIGHGLMVLLGVSGDDTKQDADYLVEKIINLRIFEDDKGKLNISLMDVKGELLVVSQFTLLGDCKKGRRPSYIKAAAPEKARRSLMILKQLSLIFRLPLALPGGLANTGRIFSHLPQPEAN